jgi:pimeloyl-ACP methyl ester carboxylesterase
MGTHARALTRARRAAPAVAFAALALTAAVAGAVTPSAQFARRPEDFKLSYASVTFPSGGDSAAIEGWWVRGPKGSSVLVMAGAGTGNRADLLPLARDLRTKGFSVLLFDYRDFGPGGAGAADTLRDVVFASRWVDDAVGALRYARAHVDSGGKVIAWGHEMGSAVMIAALARERLAAEGLAIDNPFRSIDDALRWNGTSVIPDVVRRHRLLVRSNDEPYLSAPRIAIATLLVLAGKEESAPAPAAEELFARARVRVDRFPVPDATLAGVLDSPGYVDRLVEWAKWITQWAVPRGR